MNQLALFSAERKTESAEVLTKEQIYWKSYSKIYRAKNRKNLAAKARAYYANHREERKAKNKVYSASHKPQLAARRRIYNASHKEQIAAKKKAYQVSHKEQIAAKRKIYRINHPEKIKLYNSRTKECRKAYRARNKEKLNTWRRNHKRKNKEQNIIKRRLEIYGLSQADFYAMLIKQAGGCAICGKKDWGGKYKSPNIDHDHKTRKIRGILCWQCNVALGKMNDDPEILAKAIEYLKRNS